MKQQKRMIACLAAGVLILAVSATAAFGSVNGYSAYRDGVITLAFEEENFTLQGDMHVQLDGMEVLDLTVDWTQDGPDRAYVLRGQESGTDQVEYNTTLDGTTTWFQEDWNFYYQRDGVEHYPNLMDTDTDHEMVGRAIHFASIAADTVVGELKNNVVQIGKEDGKALYQVTISQAQVPSLVSAGLSLLAYDMGGWEEEICLVEYENYTESMFTYYEAVTGQTLPQDFKDGYRDGYASSWYEANQDMISTFEDAAGQGQITVQPQQLMEEKGDVGVVFVTTDNQTEYYPDAQSYLAAHPERGGDVLTWFVAEDMVLENISCTFALDDQGRIADTHLEVEFRTTDPEGGRHTLTFAGDLAVTDYGATAIQPLDPGDRALAE